MRIAILDYVAPKDYTPESILTEPMGGTEATVCRVTTGLRERGHEVHLLTRGSKFDEFRPSHVLVLRDPKYLQYARDRWPDAKLYLWCHDLPTRELGLQIAAINAARTSHVVCVSNWAMVQTTEMFKAMGYKGGFKMTRVYNPVCVELKPATTNYHKLVWLSSPHKGLDYAYEIFSKLNSYDDAFSLFCLNPGYYFRDMPIPKGVRDIGACTHAEAMDVLRDSLCLFYPNKVFPETFGLVMAEANALGVPVLTHNLGAAKEVLDSHPSQLIDCNKVDKVIERVISWSRGSRPAVVGNESFKLSRVLSDWEKLFGST